MNAERIAESTFDAIPEQNTGGNSETKPERFVRDFQEKMLDVLLQPFEKPLKKFWKFGSGFLKKKTSSKNSWRKGFLAFI